MIGVWEKMSDNSEKMVENYVWENGRQLYLSAQNFYFKRSYYKISKRNNLKQCSHCAQNKYPLGYDKYHIDYFNYSPFNIRGFKLWTLKCFC